MDAWVIWLIAAVILAVGEIATTGFFLAPFAGGAAVAALLSALGADELVNWGAFLVISVLLLAALRPIARSHRRLPAQLRTGTAALVGKHGTVLERVALDAGCVRIEGEVWTARPFDEDETFEPGVRVQVVEIKGATALVTE